MPVGNITGLSSGIQWDDTVKLLMQIERRPVALLESRRSTYQSQLTNWSALESKLTALKSVAEGIDTTDELLVKTVSSSDSDILSATADSTAIAGTHDVLVNQLATNYVLAHRTGWADANTTAVNSSGNDQSFSYEYAGEAFTITVPTGSTLTDLVNLINNDPDNPGVTASILNDGSGGAASYHLVLSGNDTGAANTIAIIDTGPNPTDLGTGTEFDAAEWNTTQTAQNAEIRVDGFPDPAWGWPNPWIEADSNEVEDIIPGVTLHLKDVTAGTPIRIETALDKEAVEAEVNALIKAFNDLVGAVNSLTSYNPESKTAGPLAGDSLARSLRGELTAMVAASIPGAGAADRYRSLGEVGIKITSGGQLSLDSEKFDEALDTDPTAVARMFVFDAETSSGFVSVAGHSDQTVGGEYAFTLSYDASGNIDSGGTNTIGGENAIIHGDSLVGGAEGTDAEGLLVLLSNPGNGPSSLSGTLTIYTGLSSLLVSKVNAITDSVDGRLTGTRDRINDAIDLLDDRISAWDKRLAVVEQTYNRRFQAMEILVGQLRTQSNYMAGAFG